MEGIVIGVLLAFLGYVILYFVIKSAVREGIKEAYAERKKISEIEEKEDIHE